jgi:hypothetical protein
VRDVRHQPLLAREPELIERRRLRLAIQH